MRRVLRSLMVVVGGVIGVGLLAAPAFASFQAPGDTPHVVTGASDGSTPFDVKVDGFTPGALVYIELCDGSTVGAGWDPTLHCDNGTSPSSAQADGSGLATFLASDSNHQFSPAGTPLVGPSPSGIFSCVSPTGLPSGVSNGGTDPVSGLPVWNNCKLRAATNLASSTPDQQFLSLSLPSGGTNPVTPEVPFAALLPIGAIAVGGAFILFRRRRASHAAA